jgi:hypothetical protein
MRLQLRPASLPRNRHRPRQIQLTSKSQKKTRGKNSARLVVLSANHIRERATPGAPWISASVDGLFHFKPSVQCRLLAVISTGRRNTGGQPAINNSDGLPNVRPIAFSESLRNQLSHNVIFSAALVPPRNL